MTFRIELAARAAKDIDRLDRPGQQRIIKRIEQLAADPFDPRLSAELTGHSPLRRSRVGGWRIIFTVVQEAGILYVVTVERRGQVYRRLS